MDFQLNTGTTGEIAAADVAALSKALSAGYGTDAATLTGGGALRIQSLDKTLQSTIQSNEQFKLFNRLTKSRATATVDEWTEQDDVGGFLGGTTQTETGDVQDESGSYNRRTGKVKYLMTRRQVSVVSTMQNNLADIEAVEYGNGALKLCSDVEFLLWEGNSAVVPTEFDGVAHQLQDGVNTGQVDGGNVIDARAGSLSSMELVNDASATISGYGNFGTPTDIFMSMQTQADFDNRLDPAFRVGLTNVANGGVMLGAPVTGIRTSSGDIKTNRDVFIREGAQLAPFQVRKGYAPTAVKQDPIKPQAVAAAVAADAASLFSAPQGGNYYYLITGTNNAGQSTGLVSAQVAVAAGQSVSLTITPSIGGLETGYTIYRSRLNGGNIVGVGCADGISDFREMVRVPKNGAGATVFVDQNRDIPGTTKAYILNLVPGASAITWRQLMPMFKFPFAATTSLVVPWAQVIFGYCRMAKRKQHVLIKNILPVNSVFKPFN